MWDAIAFIGFVASLLFIILGIIAIIKKNGTAKKKFLYALGCFVLFIVAANLDPTSTETSEVASSEADTKTEEQLSEKDDKETAKEDKLTAEEVKKQKEEEEKLKALEAQQKYAVLAKIYIPTLTDDVLELDDKTFDFITENHSLFPAKTTEDINKAKEITDTTISAKHLNRNVNPYLDKMTVFTGTVVSIEEIPQDNETITTVHVLDNEMQSYQFLLFKPAGDIFEDDQIRFWGVPAGPSSFDNVSGGTTNVQVFVGAHMEKI